MFIFELPSKLALPVTCPVNDMFLKSDNLSAVSANVALFANFATSAISAVLADVAEPALSAYAIEQSVLSVPPFITW